MSYLKVAGRCSETEEAKFSCGLMEIWAKETRLLWLGDNNRKNHFLYKMTSSLCNLMCKVWIRYSILTNGRRLEKIHKCLLGKIYSQLEVEV